VIVHAMGDAVETFIRREDAERFIEEVRGDDPDLELHSDRGQRCGGSSRKIVTKWTP
jgi:hypothetical protein